MNNKPTHPRQRATIVDVAQHAGVSVGTASRVINGFENVNHSLRDKVMQSIAALEYRPNSSAQDVRRGQSRLVGIVVRDITVSPLARFVSFAQETLAEAGYTVLISSSNNNPDHELKLLDSLMRRGVDGLITTVASEQNEKLHNALEKLGIPIVLLDRDHPSGFDSVLIDHKSGTKLAVEHLLDIGHRRIALLTGEPNLRPSFARRHGYEAAYSGRSIQVDPSLIFAESFSGDYAYNKTVELLVDDPSITAIIVGGIGMLAGVLQAIRAQNLQIPQDISVISGSDSELAMLVSPAVTAVRWDYGEVGHNAAKLLLERLGGAAASRPRVRTFRTDLILRGSSAPPAPQKKEL